MTRLADAKLTVAEAAFVTKVDAKEIDREIDADILPGGKGRRILKRGALVYIKAIAPHRGDISPGLRKEVFSAVEAALAKRNDVAHVGSLYVHLKEIEAELVEEFKDLEAVKTKMVESRPGVLGGEPVLRGTRVPVRVVADLAKKGVSKREFKHEYDLTAEQVDAAILYDKITPRRGRPPIKRRKVKVHVSAD
jgi:uncharacterized protein (DUF433 family)